VSAWEGPHLQAVKAQGKPPQHEILLAVFKDNYHLAVTSGGQPFAMSHAVPGVMIPLKHSTGALRQRLAADMYMVTGRQPSQEAQATVMSTLEGIAHTSHRIDPSLRVAQDSAGSIVLDLGRPDGHAVVLNAGGWQVAQRGAGVLFRRTALTGPLPDPVPGGDPRPALSLLHFRGRDELAVYAACRVASLFPGVTRPVEIITGQPGSAKTSTTRITAGWLGGAMVPMSRDLKDWAALANGAHSIGHDNVSGISAERSDLLCKAASGDTWAARTLFTDLDLLVVQFSPVSVVINGVDTGALRGDLVRRSAWHHLDKPPVLLGDTQVRQMWAAAHPGVLGWTLDLACQVLAAMSRVRADPAESMQDFARVLACVDALWGTSGLAMWKDGQSDAYTDLLEDDAVAMAIRAGITEVWEGQSSDLLNRIGLILPEEHGKQWSPRRLSGALDRCQAALEQAGWVVTRSNNNKTRSRRIGLVPPQCANGHRPVPVPSATPESG
jgi:hypothetical protein